MIHYIYCYENKINNKKYIGQTNNLERRKKQHIQDSIHLHKNHENAYNQPIHNAIRKYGIDNFDIKILEIIDTDELQKVNDLESKYIKELNTMSPNGYNLQAQGICNPGGNKSKIAEEDIVNIIKDLKDGVPLTEIAEKYEISYSYVSTINNGECLRKENETYPLQHTRMSNDTYLNIIDMLKNTKYTYKEIARVLNCHPDTVRKINYGKSQIIKAIYNDTFPIRKDARRGYTLKTCRDYSELDRK